MVKADQSTNEITYVVEKIIDYRLIRGSGRNKIALKIELHIKWEGYPDDDNTWEPLSSIYEDIGQLVRKFFKDQGLNLKRKILDNLDLDDPRQSQKFTLLGKGGQPLKTIMPARISKKQIKKPVPDSGGNCKIQIAKYQPTIIRIKFQNSKQIKRILSQPPCAAQSAEPAEAQPHLARTPQQVEKAKQAILTKKIQPLVDRLMSKFGSESQEKQISTLLLNSYQTDRDYRKDPFLESEIKVRQVEPYREPVSEQTQIDVEDAQLPTANQKINFRNNLPQLCDYRPPHVHKVGQELRNLYQPLQIQNQSTLLQEAIPPPVLPLLQDTQLSTLLLIQLNDQRSQNQPQNTSQQQVMAYANQMQPHISSIWAKQDLQQKDFPVQLPYEQGVQPLINDKFCHY